MKQYTAVCFGVLAVANFASTNLPITAARGSQRVRLRSQARLSPEFIPLTVFRATSGDPINSIAFSPDGTLLAAGAYDGSIGLWDVRARVLIRKMEPGRSEIHSVAFSPDGKLVAGGSHEGTVILWDTSSGHAVRTLNVESGVVSSVVFSPNGHLIAVAVQGSKLGETYSEIKLFDSHSGDLMRTILQEHVWLNAVAFSKSGLAIAGAGGDWSARLWNVDDGRIIATYNGRTVAGNCLVFSRDSKYLAVGGGLFHEGRPHAGAVDLFDLKRHTLDKSLMGHHEDCVNAVAFCASGNVIASGGLDAQTLLWDSRSGSLIQSVPGLGSGVTSLAFSPKGDLLAIADFDGAIQLEQVKQRGSSSPRHSARSKSDRVGNVSQLPIMRTGKHPS